MTAEEQAADRDRVLLGNAGDHTWANANGEQSGKITVPMVQLGITFLTIMLVPRAYRWGEDGIAGISDNHQRLCFDALEWRRSILKERILA